MKKIFNKGQRKIYYDGGVFLPQEAKSFENKVAKNLIKLFRDELIDMDNVTPADFINKKAKAERPKQDQDVELKKAKAEIEALTARAESAEKAVSDAFKVDEAEESAKDESPYEGFRSEPKKRGPKPKV